MFYNLLFIFVNKLKSDINLIILILLEIVMYAILPLITKF